MAWTAPLPSPRKKSICIAMSSRRVKVALNAVSSLSSLVEMNDFNLTIAALNVNMVSLLNGDATQCRTWILIQ